jgi:hypothetical protein
VIPAFAPPATLPKIPGAPLLAHAGLVALAGEVAAVPVDGIRLGSIGIDEPSPRVLAVGDTVCSGTAGAELTPRLPISKDPNGIPVRAAPPCVKGEVDAGLDDTATLPEPEPHIPEVPDVSSIPEDVDIAGDVDVPASDDVATPGIASMPGSTAVAGVETPGVVPPPSYIALDPNICEGEVATVEHPVPLLVVGIEMLPARPVGAGLTPADVISVEPSGIPVGELVEPIPMPSGEVAPIVGVGVTASATCAIAGLQTISTKKTAAIDDNPAVVLDRDFVLSIGRPAWCAVAAPVPIGFAISPAGARLSDIDQSLVLRWSTFGA